MSETSRYLNSKRNKETIFWSARRKMEREHNWFLDPFTNFREGLIVPHGMGGIYITQFDFGGLTIIHQNVSIGRRAGKEYSDGGYSEGFLYIGAGAYIAGDIKIGANVIIGANATITKDIPSNSIVVGNNRILDDPGSQKIADYKKELLSSFSNYIGNPKKMYWPNKVSSLPNYSHIVMIREVRNKYERSISKEEIDGLKKEYKNILKGNKVYILQRLIWSKIYRLFSGIWLKTN